MEYPKKHDIPVWDNLVDLQKALLLNYQHIYSYNEKYLKYVTEEEAIPIENLDIAEDEMLLGFKSLDYNLDNAFITKIGIFESEGGEYVPKSQIFTIIGERGSGKSILASIIGLDNIVQRFQLPTFIIDPSPTGEWGSHKKTILKKFPSQRNKISSFFETINVEPQGINYNIIVYQPKFDSDFKEEGVDKFFLLYYSDFLQLYKFSHLEATQIFIDIVNLDDTRPTMVVVGDMFIKYNKEDNSFSEILDNYGKKSNTYSKGDEMASISRVFPYALQSAINLGIVNGGVNKDKMVNNKAVLKNNVLEDLENKDAVVLRIKAKSSNESNITKRYEACIKIVLTKILNDRLLFSSGTKEEKVKSHLTNPNGILVIIEEADTIAPATGGNYVKELIKQLATKYRKAYINVILITQDAGTLDETLLKQSSVIFCSQIQTLGNIKALKEKGIDKITIDKLKNLRKNQRNSLGLLVSEWAMIDANKKIELFYPTIPHSSFFS